jgi:hypothetical protein
VRNNVTRVAFSRTEWNRRTATMKRDHPTPQVTTRR